MGRLVGLLLVALIAILSYSYLFKKTETPGTATPTATIDGVRAKNAILSIAQAERLYQAEHGNYGSIDDLKSAGGMTIPDASRTGYTYDVDARTDGFRVVAQCTITGISCPSYAVDQSMEVQTLP